MKACAEPTCIIFFGQKINLWRIFMEESKSYFDGKAIQLFGSWIKWFLLTIITLGIYRFWLPIKLRQWKTKHTSFVEI